jgi:outer membrane protein
MRLHKLFFTILVVVGFCCMAIESFAADIAKIGVIDVPRILATSSGGKMANTELQKQGNRMKGSLEKALGEFNELKKRYEREALVMSREMRESKERELKILQMDIEAQERKYSKDFQVLNQKLTDRIRKEIMTVVDKIGKKGGYLLIVEKGAVMYAPKKVDITDAVIQDYNSSFAKQKSSE